MDEFDLNNLQQILRMNNLFHPQGVSLGGDQQLQQPSPQPQQQFDPAARLNQLYHPQMQASQAFQSALQQMPQRPNPSNFRKVMGAVAGLGAGISPVGIADGQVVGAKYNPAAQMSAQESVTSGPYHQKLQDWSAKAGVLERGAREEDVSNKNQRMLAEQQISREEKQQQINEEKRRDLEKEKNARDRTEVYKHKTEIYDSIAKGGSIQIDRNGDMYVVYKDSTKKAVDINKFTPEEIIDLKRDAALKEIKTRTEGAKEVAGVKGAEARSTKGTTPAAKPVTPKPVTPPKEEQPTQAKVRIFNRATQALQEHPEWKDYVKLGGNNTVIFSTPSWYKGGADKKTMDTIHDYVYGTDPNKPKILSITPIK